MEPVAIGDSVVFVDMHGHTHNALVCAVHNGDNPEKYPNAAINCVYLSEDSAKVDPYGRQVERATSISHMTGFTAAGNYWRRHNEKKETLT